MARPGNQARHHGGNHRRLTWRGSRVHPASEYLHQPGGLAERLNGLRETAGLTGEALAGMLGWSSSKVSKIQNGRQLPTAKDIQAWADATGHSEVTDELL